MVDYYREGFEDVRPQVKQEFETLLNQVGITGVLEILAEIAEEYASCSSSPKSLAYWKTAAANTKHLSKELFKKGLLDGYDNT